MPSDQPQFLRTVTSLAAVLPALATALVWLPPLFTSEQHQPPLWWLLTIVSAPIVAFVVNLIRPTATSWAPGLWTGIPQVFTLIGMIRLDVWLDVRSGYYPPGTSDEAMAYGFGTLAGVVGGCVLMLLVAVGGGVGVSHSRRT